MKTYHHLLAICTFVAALGGGLSTAHAAVPNGIALRDDARCTTCHDESDKGGAALRIAKTRHGTVADGRTPTCSSCHGPSNAHVDYKGSAKPPKPDFTFGKLSRTETQARNQSCMSCHDTDAQRRHWAGSAHQTRDVACTSCHSIHTPHDAVRGKFTQAEVCYTCHKDQRALANKPSHHPIPEGKMLCSDCHNPHGTLGEKGLIKDTVNDTCFTCHAEKRGPFVWAHQPVTDSCVNCHNPHGTTADSMLKTRAPFLCLSCHDPSSHLGYVPGVVGNVNTAKNPSGTTISTTTPPDNWNTNTAVGKTQGMSCMNCHSEIHGSNNPVNSTNAKRFWR